MQEAECRALARLFACPCLIDCHPDTNGVQEAEYCALTRLIACYPGTLDDHQEAKYRALALFL